MTNIIMTTKKPLTFRQALTILADINVSYGIFNENPFASIVKKPYNQPMPTPEEICKLIAERNTKSLANDIKRSECQDRKGERLRNKKKKAWSIVQRRGLLTGQLRYLKAQIPLKDQYQTFYREVEGANLTYPVGTRGPPQYYDRVALVTAVALKFLHDIDWLELPRCLRDTGIDLRQPDKKIAEIDPK